MRPTLPRHRLSKILEFGEKPIAQFSRCLSSENRFGDAFGRSPSSPDDRDHR